MFDPRTLNPETYLKPGIFIMFILLNKYGVVAQLR